MFSKYIFLAARSYPCVSGSSGPRPPRGLSFRFRRLQTWLYPNASLCLLEYSVGFRGVQNVYFDFTAQTFTSEVTLFSRCVFSACTNMVHLQLYWRRHLLPFALSFLFENREEKVGGLLDDFNAVYVDCMYVSFGAV